MTSFQDILFRGRQITWSFWPDCKIECSEMSSVSGQKMWFPQLISGLIYCFQEMNCKKVSNSRWPIFREHKTIHCVLHTTGSNLLPQTKKEANLNHIYWHCTCHYKLTQGNTPYFPTPSWAVKELDRVITMESPLSLNFGTRTCKHA